MLLYLQHNAHSTQPMYETCFVMKSIHSMGYTSEPIVYKTIEESEINPMSLAYAQSSFSQDWNIENQEENEYWESFVK